MAAALPRRRVVHSAPHVWGRRRPQVAQDPYQSCACKAIFISLPCHALLPRQWYATYLAGPPAWRPSTTCSVPRPRPAQASGSIDGPCPLAWQAS